MALMVHDSDSNAAKTWFVHVKSGGQTLFFDPPLEKVGGGGQLTPLTPCFRGLCGPPESHCGDGRWSRHFSASCAGHSFSTPCLDRLYSRLNTSRSVGMLYFCCKKGELDTSKCASRLPSQSFHYIDHLRAIFFIPYTT